MYLKPLPPGSIFVWLLNFSNKFAAAAAVVVGSLLLLLIDAHALWTDGLALHGIEGLAANGLLAVLKDKRDQDERLKGVHMIKASEGKVLKENLQEYIINLFIIFHCFLVIVRLWKNIYIKLAHLRSKNQ